MNEYLKRIGIAISVLLNVICGGYSNQTFSARNHDLKRRNLFNVAFFIDWIYLILKGERDHCLNSWVYWYTRKNLKNNIEHGDQTVFYEGII